MYMYMHRHVYIEMQNVYTCIHCTCQDETDVELDKLQLCRKYSTPFTGCAVLPCLVCLFDLACFFFSSFSSLI